MKNKKLELKKLLQEVKTDDFQNKEDLKNRYISISDSELSNFLTNAYKTFKLTENQNEAFGYWGGISFVIKEDLSDYKIDGWSQYSGNGASYEQDYEQAIDIIEDFLCKLIK